MATPCWELERKSTMSWEHFNIGKIMKNIVIVINTIWKGLLSAFRNFWNRTIGWSYIDSKLNSLNQIWHCEVQTIYYIKLWVAVLFVLLVFNQNVTNISSLMKFRPESVGNKNETHHIVDIVYVEFLTSNNWICKVNWIVQWIERNEW